MTRPALTCYAYLVRSRTFLFLHARSLFRRNKSFQTGPPIACIVGAAVTRVLQLLLHVFLKHVRIETDLSYIS